MDRQRAVAQLKAMGESNRLDLFLRLAGGETGGSDLLRSTGLSQPSLSRHLRVLREAGVIVERWAGRNAYYRLSDEPLALSLVGILGGEGGFPPRTGRDRSVEPENMSKRESDAALPLAGAGGGSDAAPPTEEDVAPPMEDWLL